MVLVVFKNDYDQTCCMMTEKFKTVKDAKAAIECDGAAFADAHRGDGVITHRTQKKWIEPKSRDFYKVIGGDGHSCIYQYFNMG